MIASRRDAQRLNDSSISNAERYIQVVLGQNSWDLAPSSSLLSLLLPLPFPSLSLPFLLPFFPLPPDRSIGHLTTAIGQRSPSGVPGGTPAEIEFCAF